MKSNHEKKKTGTVKNLSDVNLNAYREFPDLDELIFAMKYNPHVLSWGAEGFTRYLSKFLQFKVNGYRFQGWVCIGANAADLLNVFFIDKDQNIEFILEDVFISDLILQLHRTIGRNRSIVSF